MAVLAADANCTAEGAILTTTVKAAGADTYYAGALVWADLTGAIAAGYAKVASIAAGDRILGICTKKQVATAQGDPIEIAVEGSVWLPLGDSVTIADVGDYLVHDIGSVQTDNPADCESGTDATLADGDAMVGRILNATATKMLIDLNPGAIYDSTGVTAWV